MVRRIKNLYHYLVALAAASFYSFPSKEIKVVGVTGTDGKTTTVHMIADILSKNNFKTSYISSLHAAIGSKIYKTGFHVTTPTAWQIQRLLRQAVNARHSYFVVEATSHGLDQHRLSFINFEVGVLTNITHEHMDYHKTWENYAQAKLILLKNSKFRILNLDDTRSYEFVKKHLKKNLISYSLNSNSDVNSKNFPLKLKVPGKFNLQNALAAGSCALALNLTKNKIIKALNNFESVEGRMDEIDLGQKFKVLVDFAHTPNALENSLKTLKETSPKKSRLIAVFGSAGLRDKSKRPLMGRVADNFADVIILTAEDPRIESVSQINSEIQSGIKNKKLNKDLFVIADRKQAIEFAVNMAGDGDIVGLFGKGHEKSMCIGKTETPWSEFEVARFAIKRRLSELKKK